MLKIEKRRFKRYESQSKCEVRLDTGTYKGKILDYSDGVSVIIENAPKLALGAQADIKSLDSKIELKGEVVWVQEFDDYIKVGFRRADYLKGSLQDFKLPDILNSLQRNTKTGILIVESGSVVKKIFIKDGDVKFAASNNENDRLGELLIREGKITRKEHKEADALLKTTGERLGKILVDLRYLKPKEIFQAVQRQIEEIILSLFSLEDGEFEFQEGPLPAKELITLRISTANLIYSGIKRINNVQYLQQICPPVDAVLNFSQCALNIFQYFTVDEPDKKILSYVNGKNSIKMILSLSPSSYFETLKTIHAFLSIGLIEVKKEAEAPVVHPIEEVINEPDKRISREFVEKIEDMLNRYESLSYYEILGLKKNTSFGEIKKAAYILLKEFHPDRHFSLSSYDSTIKTRLTLILSHIVKVYETLYDPEKRKEYDRILSSKTTRLVKKITGVIVVAVILGVTLPVVYENFNNAPQSPVPAVKKSKRDIKGQLPVSYSLEIFPKTAFSDTNFHVVSKNFNISEAHVQWLIDETPVPNVKSIQFRPQNVGKGSLIQARMIIKGKEILSNVIEIRNVPPEISNANILPKVFKTGDKLFVEAAGSDMDEDEVTFLYEWTKNGEYAGNSKQLDVPLLRGNKISVKIVPFDGEDYGQPVVIDTEILNRLPMIIEDFTYDFNGKVYNYQVKATDPDEDPLAYSLKSAPAGMTINPSTGLINWNVPPDFYGKASFTVSVTDGNSGEATHDFSMTIDTVPAP